PRQALHRRRVPRDVGQDPDDAPGRRMSGESGRPSSEFLSEAQEVVESFSRSLLELDAQQRRGDYDPDLLNAAFRAIHSLKGLSSLFGASAISELSHA